jgi:hypothetical protein
MRPALRPATLALAAVLVSLAACSSPTAPAPMKTQAAPAVKDLVTDAPPVDSTGRSGYIIPNG